MLPNILLTILIFQSKHFLLLDITIALNIYGSFPITTVNVWADTSRHIISLLYRFPGKYSQAALKTICLMPKADWWTLCCCILCSDHFKVATIAKSGYAKNLIVSLQKFVVRSIGFCATFNILTFLWHKLRDGFN